MKFKKINVTRLFGKDYRQRDTYQCNSSAGGFGAGACREKTPSARYGWEPEDRRDTGGAREKQIKNSGIAPSYNQRSDSMPRCTDGEMRDRGNEPIVFDIRKEAFMTPDFRTALWTGGNLQLTVMTIPVGEETGVERHEGLDQLIGVISGAGEVVFGNRENYFAPPIPLDAHSVVLIPAGTYHNVKNVGRTPLKLYSVYAPKAHKFGTVDKEKT